MLSVRHNSLPVILKGTAYLNLFSANLPLQASRTFYIAVLFRQWYQINIDAIAIKLVYSIIAHYFTTQELLCFAWRLRGRDAWH